MTFQNEVNFTSMTTSLEGRLSAAATEANGIFLSYDLGESWNLSSASQLVAWKAMAMNATGHVIYAAGSSGGGLWLSSTGGLSWARTNLSLSTSWTGLACDGTGQIILACGDDGLWLSTSRGDNWTAITSLAGTNWSSVSVNAQGTVLYASDTSSTIYFSNDTGVTWTDLPPLSEGVWLEVVCNSLGNLLAGIVQINATSLSTMTTDLFLEDITSSSYRGIYLSTLNASGASATFLTSAPLLPWVTLAMSATGETLAAAATGYGIYVSTNQGMSWALLLSTPNNDWSGLSMDARSSVVTASTSGGQIWTARLPVPSFFPSSAPTPSPTSTSLFANLDDTPAKGYMFLACLPAAFLFAGEGVTRGVRFLSRHTSELCTRPASSLSLFFLATKAGVWMFFILNLSHHSLASAPGAWLILWFARAVEVIATIVLLRWLLAPAADAKPSQSSDPSDSGPSRESRHSAWEAHSVRTSYSIGTIADQSHFLPTQPLQAYLYVPALLHTSVGPVLDSVWYRVILVTTVLHVEGWNTLPWKKTPFTAEQEGGLPTLYSVSCVYGSLLLSEVATAVGVVLICLQQWNVRTEDIVFLVLAYINALRVIVRVSLLAYRWKQLAQADQETTIFLFKPDRNSTLRRLEEGGSVIEMSRPSGATVHNNPIHGSSHVIAELARTSGQGDEGKVEDQDEDDEDEAAAERAKEKRRKVQGKRGEEKGGGPAKHIDKSRRKGAGPAKQDDLVSLTSLSTFAHRASR